jgi:hypothetical protein
MSDKIKRGERCKHGVRWPHECKDCLAESELAPARGYTARLEQLKSELNERRLTECDQMLTDAGVPEWVMNTGCDGVPSNSVVARLKWYLARRKNVAVREIDQNLQREMKVAEADAREYVGWYNKANMVNTNYEPQTNT